MADHSEKFLVLFGVYSEKFIVSLYIPSSSRNVVNKTNQLVFNCNSLLTRSSLILCWLDSDDYLSELTTHWCDSTNFLQLIIRAVVKRSITLGTVFGLERKWFS